MDRHDVTAQILAAKRRKGLLFTQIAEHVGADRVWLTAADPTIYRLFRARMARPLVPTHLCVPSVCFCA